MLRPLVILLCLAPAVANADPIFDRVVEEKTTEAAGINTKWYRPSDPQALTNVLLRTGLLETLHHFGVTPKDGARGIDTRAMSKLGQLDAAGRRYAFLFGDDALRAVMVRIPVPVVPETGADRGWKRERLGHRKTALADLGRYRLKASKKDQYGNVFEWKGLAPGGRVFVRYLPKTDEIVALFVSG